MELKLERVIAHPLRARIKRLEPGILLVHALERELQTET